LRGRLTILAQLLADLDLLEKVLLRVLRVGGEALLLRLDDEGLDLGELAVGFGLGLVLFQARLAAVVSAQ